MGQSTADDRRVVFDSPEPTTLRYDANEGQTNKNDGVIVTVSGVDAQLFSLPGRENKKGKATQRVVFTSPEPQVIKVKARNKTNK